MSSPFALSMWTRDGAAGAAPGAPRSAHPRWSPLVPAGLTAERAAAFPAGPEPRGQAILTSRLQ